MKFLGGLLLFLVSATVNSLWSGFVLSKMWTWFVVTGLHVPALSVGYAIGAGTVAQYMTGAYSRPHTEEEGKSVTQQIVVSGLRGLITGAFVLGYGAIVKSFL
jgi:hypothetical protein